MKSLTKREEQIMEVIMKLKNAYIKDIREAMPAPQPHYNTVATIVKILVKKGILQSEMLGNTHQYSPTVDFEDYREEHVSSLKEKFFGNSFPSMMAYFAKQESLSEEEMEELIRIIKSKKS